MGRTVLTLAEIALTIPDGDPIVDSFGHVMQLSKRLHYGPACMQVGLTLDQLDAHDAVIMKHLGIGRERDTWDNRLREKA